MQILQQLIDAGFNRGQDGKAGLDSTVSSLDWALANLGSTRTSRNYAADAASSLEARLVASYVIQSIAYLNSGDFASAQREYQKARTLQEITAHDGGCSRCSQVEDALNQLEEMLGEKQASAAA